MFVIALASLVLASSPDHVGTYPQQDPAGPVVDLDDVIVEGRPLEDMTRDFVNEVSAPTRNRGLARWRNGICVGVANLQTDAAQYIADRVSTVAQDVGLRAGSPGCRPSVLVIATNDASSFTQAFVDRRPGLFRVGGSGTDLGRSSFRTFLTSEAPVRWWNVSFPVHDDTGQITVRLPADFNIGSLQNDNGVASRGPTFNVTASRLRSEIVDDAKRSFLIIDLDKIGGVSLQQLADYIAFVALAQIDPEADTSSYATILNVFDDPSQTVSLTDWDVAYLQGLYDTTRTRMNTQSQRGEVASSIARANRELRGY